jgi:hypothetical protein
MPTSTVDPQRTYLDIPSAAHEAGYSLKDFRKIIKEDHIPVTQIGEKSFIAASDYKEWESTRGEARFERSLHQLDLWLKISLKASAEPADDMDDED